MSFTLEPGKPIRRELKQLVDHQLRGAGRGFREGGGVAIHEARTAVKKVRAILRLLREANTDGLGKDERRLRAVGQVLSTLRDSDAVIATFDLLRRRFPKRLPEHSKAVIRRRLVQARTRLAREARDNHSVATAAHTLRVVRRSAKRWDVPIFESLDLSNLLKESYRASRNAMHRAQKTTRGSDLHRWRKRVKTLWYQLRLIESRAPGLRATIQDLEQLETWLGDHQNLSVLQAAIADQKKTGQQSLAVLRRLMVVSRSVQKSLRAKALARGRGLMTDRPKTFARSLRRALSASRRKKAAAPAAAAA
jgi:CHAD domain-containing protein